MSTIVSDQQLDSTFAALADPTRRAILARLAAGEASVTEIAAPFKMTLPAVSKHLKVLERAGLIARGRDAQWRPCRLKPEPLKGAVDWLERYRENWEESFSRLDEFLREVRAEVDTDKGQGERDEGREADQKERGTRPHGRPGNQRQEESDSTGGT